MSLAEELQEKLAYKISFYIPLGNWKIPVPQSVVATWGAMLFLVVLAIIFTRKLEIVPRGKQAVLEVFMEKLYDLFYGILGPKGKYLIPYLITIILFIGTTNLSGILGLAPATKDLNTTAGLALMSIVMVEYAGIRNRGVKGWLKSFSEPVALVTPINILELGIKPLSLCMRLFGNMIGAYIIMELLRYALPAVVPLIGSAYFDIFDGILQAYIFCFLTALFMKEAMGEED